MRVRRFGIDLSTCIMLVFGLCSMNYAFAMRMDKDLSVFQKGISPWTSTGDAWGIVHTPRVGEPLHPHPESQAGGEAAVGMIRSPVFTINGDIITFMANGWDGRYGGKGLNGFFLKRASDNVILRKTAPPDQDAFVKITWLVSDLIGEKVYFEAVDRDNNENGTGPGFAWIGFDHVKMFSLDVPASQSHLHPIRLPSPQSTWQILSYDGAHRTVAPYLSSLGYGEPGVGAVQSPVFRIESNIITVTLCGWSGRNGERHASYVQLVDAESNKPLIQSPPPLSDALHPIEWNVSSWVGRRVKVRLVDSDTGSSFAWIGLGMVDARPSYFVNFATEKTGSFSLLNWTPVSSDEEQFVEAWGVPFLCTPGSLMQRGGSCVIPINLVVDRLYMAGFTGTFDQGEEVWEDPNDHYHRLFIGDKLGDIYLDYADGTSQRYPLLYGYSAWWWQPIQDAPEPFLSSKKARTILSGSLSLLPTGSGGTGAYMGVINPERKPLKDIRIVDNPDKAGEPVISGITINARQSSPVLLPALPHDRPSSKELAWMKANALKPNADRNVKILSALRRLKNLLYTSPRDFRSHIPISMPKGYVGPRVRFTGDVYADVLTSVFYNDVQDILDKVDSSGMYHTSTLNAPSWGGYTGIGTWRDDANSYYSQSWSRDLGRSLQEITELGYLTKAQKCADYCFKDAQLWTDDPALKYRGVQLPPHWGRIVNMPSPHLGDGVFENDGHGLIMLFTYKLWQREPDRSAWLIARWKDVQAAGDWIQWQLSHPDISGATDVLMTDSECAGGIGNAKYADFLCEEGLRAYADMADSIKHQRTANRWRTTADRLLQGMENTYYLNDPRWGATWTASPAGWPNQSTNLGPLIILADRRGFAPDDNIAGWRIRDVNAYRRMISQYSPFGYYGVAMGYGQGFVTQSALLLDRMKDATTMLHWMARAIYYPYYKPFITPEGSELDPSGGYWRRTGDLGNGVQEGETVKALRLVIGVDDDRPDQDQLIPRLPIGWNEIDISNYPFLTTNSDGTNVTRRVHYRLQRTKNGMTLSFGSNGAIHSMMVRIGPFASGEVRARLNGKPLNVTAVKNGDSYWIYAPTMRDVRNFTMKAEGIVR